MFFEGILTGIAIMGFVAFLVSNCPLGFQKIIFKYKPLMDIILSVAVVYLALGSSTMMLLGSVLAGLGLSVYIKVMHKVLYFYKYDRHNFLTKYLHKIYIKRYGEEELSPKDKTGFDWFGLRKSKA